MDLEAGGGHLFNRGLLHIKGDASFREGVSGTDVRLFFFPSFLCLSPSLVARVPQPYSTYISYITQSTWKPSNVIFATLSRPLLF